VGAIPGALPPVIGWAAAGATLDLAAFSLFGILFLWQFPHFMAIAWKYRDEYLVAGLKMLPMGLPKPHITGLIATAYAVLLIPISLLPVVAGVGGEIYFISAIVLGVAYLAASIAFALNERPATARRLILTSIVYLPLVLIILVCDHLAVF
jgi:protoheme IX farnesyltransferase